MAGFAVRSKSGRLLGSALLAALAGTMPAAAQDLVVEPALAEPAPADATPAEKLAAEPLAIETGSDAAAAAAILGAVSVGALAAPLMRDRRSQIVVWAAPGSAVSAFHMVKQSSCKRSGRWRDEASGCAGWLRRTMAFGPKPVNSRYRLRTGSNYFLVPVCARALDWKSHSLANGSMDNNRVELKCGLP